LEATKRNSIFLSYLAHSAEARKPPIGVLGRFLVNRGGQFPGTLDLKINGVAPIVEVARVHALSVGLPAVNTFERLEKLAMLGPISRRGSADLIDALDFIGTLRLRHQMQMAREGRRPNNNVRPADLSAEERKHLRAAFKVVKLMQSAMVGRYGHGYF
jgi:CBS domain-containing protein